MHFEPFLVFCYKKICHFEYETKTKPQKIQLKSESSRTISLLRNRAHHKLCFCFLLFKMKNIMLMYKTYESTHHIRWLGDSQCGFWNTDVHLIVVQVMVANAVFFFSL
jgi:hypothetical protein